MKKKKEKILFILQCAKSKNLLPNFYCFRSDQSLSRVQLFATPWITARQASLWLKYSK